MIRKLNLLHYLPEETYRKICIKFNLDPDSPRDNIAEFGGEALANISLYNITYKEFGHIWFMEAGIDFPRFGCSYDGFGKALYEHYQAKFGREIMAGFPPYDELCCNYIEYSSRIEAENIPEVMRLLAAKCSPEQLDRALWDKYKKPHGTIEFCAAENGNSIDILARCHGTALKKRVTDAALHRTVGLLPDAAINGQTEEQILSWLCKKHGIAAYVPVSFIQPRQ